MVPRRRAGLLARVGLGPKDVGTLLLAATGLVGYLKNTDKITATAERGGAQYAASIAQVARLQAQVDSLRIRMRKVERRSLRQSGRVAVDSDTVAVESPQSPGLVRRFFSVLWSPFKGGNT